MLPTTNSSEYEPLINTSIDSNDNTINKRTFSFKTILVFLIVLIATGIIIYEIFPRNDIFQSSSNTLSNTKWVRMESSHEHASKVPKSWSLKQECAETHQFTLTLALKQQNTEQLHEHVAAVSHPRNTDSYHKYWTAEKVRQYFAPTKEALGTVKQWLNENGFSEENGKMNLVSVYGNVIRVTLTCGDANKLLNTIYYEYENANNGKTHLRVKDGIYNIPDNVFEHIDFMSPTIRFPLNRHSFSIQTHLSREEMEKIKISSHIKDSKITNKEAHDIGGDGSDGNRRSPVDADDSDEAELNPNTPTRISSLYQMDSTYADLMGDLTELDSSVCRQSIASFIEQYYSDADIEEFWTDLQVSPISSMERVPDTQPQGYGSEAELDTQYITSTGRGIYTYVYYIDSDDIFVSLAEAILDTEIPPLVVSISYGADEYELGQDWTTRCNTEFGKLALIGTTVLASSGDSGALGNDEDCLNGEDDNNWYSSSTGGGKGRSLLDATGNDGSVGDNSNGGHAKLPSSGGGSGSSGSKGKSSSSSSGTTSTYSYIASFPASAPYVTAVGGTQGGVSQESIDSFTGELAWEYSGGGFSIYFDQPEWQTNAINNYLNNADLTLPDSSRYVSTGRAYPDISAQSVDYVIAYDGEFYLVSGTSASSPTIAGMISLINYARIQNGKTSLGFLNPTLYSLYDENQNYYFNDITEGYNIGCEVDENIGFYAAEGWDPLTGVGTPKFERIYDALLNAD